MVTYVRFDQYYGRILGTATRAFRQERYSYNLYLATRDGNITFLDIYDEELEQKVLIGSLNIVSLIGMIASLSVRNALRYEFPEPVQISIAYQSFLWHDHLAFLDDRIEGEVVIALTDLSFFRFLCLTTVNAILSTINPPED